MQESFHLKKIDEYTYDPSKPIAKDAFVTTFKAVNIQNNQEFAVRILPLHKFSDSNFQEELIKGINLQKDIQSEHIVRIFDVKRTINNFYIFSELCEGETLEKKLKNGHTFTEDQACGILRQITDAVLSLGNVMHCHIKPENIVISEGKVKLTDSIFAKAIEEAENKMGLYHNQLGTPFFLAPQILNDEPYSEKCDIWSAGYVFYEVLFGKLPWTGVSVPNLLKNIRTKPLVFPKEISQETQDLLKKMLEYHETDRISWREIQEHPVVQRSSSSS